MDRERSMIRDELIDVVTELISDAALPATTPNVRRALRLVRENVELDPDLRAMAASIIRTQNVDLFAARIHCDDEYERKRAERKAGWDATP